MSICFRLARRYIIHRLGSITPVFRLATYPVSGNSKNRIFSPVVSPERESQVIRDYRVLCTVDNLMVNYCIVTTKRFLIPKP